MPRSKRSKKARPIAPFSPNSVAYAHVTPEMEKLEESTIVYYDNLTAADMAEQSDWGRVSAAQLLQARASHCS